MAVRDIAHVELYTHDSQSSVNYFTAAMGFTKAAEYADHDRSCVLLRQGEVRLVVTSGPATSRFLEQHGDGIADIALTCDDVAATRTAALAAGALPASAMPGQVAVSGFGGVRHTLLPHPGADGEPPVDRAWTAVANLSSPVDGRIGVLDHLAICLEGGSLSERANFYGSAFGLARYSSEYVDTGGQGMDSIVVRSESGKVTFTLVAPDVKKSPGQLDAFLDRNSGAGVQHLAFGVDEIIEATREFRAKGVEFLSTPGTYYDMLQERFPGLSDEIADLRAEHVLADRDEWGYLLQLFSRSPYERNTLFFELIQRRGSRGFGSANIRALYEAVERDRLAVE
jgi:4-hydroxymandelate synthase